MIDKIVKFLREYSLIFSIILFVIGIGPFIMGLIYMFAENAELGIISKLIHKLGGWNMYLLVIGFIVFAMGAYYLYKYITNKKFILKELETNKRSEFLKKHSELKVYVRHMPSKYHKMLKEKEKELKIK